MKLISGGQTGVDRAALDAALEKQLDCGGWCPEARKAEDGVIPERYPVIELANAGYKQRTKQNVLDSDGTVIIYFSYPTGGTEQTLAFCISLKKPYVLIDASELSPEQASKKVNQFVRDNSINILNVAGPRASNEPLAYQFTKTVISKWIKTGIANISRLKGAVLSRDRKYRYVLWREWDSSKGTCVFIGLNPSSADESEDDPTLRRCIGFAKNWGYGRCVMLNLFAFRATRPQELKQHKNPVGYKNNTHIIQQCELADEIVLDWGNQGSFLNRDKQVLRLLKHYTLSCFYLTQKEQPAHPLYQPKNAHLLPYINPYAE